MKKINSHFQRFHIETIMYLIILIIALILLYLVMNNKLNIFQHFSGCPVPELPLPDIEDNDIYKFNKPLNKDISLLFIHSPHCPYSVNFKENVWDNYFIKNKNHDMKNDDDNIVDRHGHGKDKEPNSDFGFDNMKYVLNKDSDPKNYRIHSFFNDKFRSIFYYNLINATVDKDAPDEKIDIIKTIIPLDGGDKGQSNRKKIYDYFNNVLLNTNNLKLLKTPIILLVDRYFFYEIDDETTLKSFFKYKSYNYGIINDYNINFDKDIIGEYTSESNEIINKDDSEKKSGLLLKIRPDNFEKDIGSYLDLRFKIFQSGEDGIITCHKERNKISGVSNPNYGSDENTKPYIFIFAENKCKNTYGKPIQNLQKFVTQEIDAKTPYIIDDDGAGRLKGWNYGLDKNKISMLTDDFKKSISLNITSCPTFILQYGNHYEFIHNEKLLDGWRDKLTVTEEDVDENTKRWETSGELKEILHNFADYYDTNKPTTAVEQTTSAADKQEQEQEQTTSAAAEQEQEKTQTTSTG